MKVLTISLIYFLLGCSTSTLGENMNQQYQKEWSGEAGYCNCLLTVMCRADIYSLEINSGSNVPNLEVLAKNKPDTVAWLHAQEFQYSSINQDAVIKILAESANISRMPWGKKEGEIHVHDVVGDDGPVVQRIFTFRLRHKKGITTLILELKKP